MTSHLVKCIEDTSCKIEGVDFVICNICNFHAQNLSIHLKKIHSLNKEKYIGQTVSEKSHQAYGDNHFQYLKHAKENNIDLTEYKGKVSKGVRSAILNNPDEIDRRSKLMSKINQSDFMRKKSSETAKKTSSRSEIIKIRSEQLNSWRKNNPQDFYNKCIHKMINSWHSKPETKLFEFISNINGFNFKRNQRVKSELFISSTKEKQIDMCDKEKRIYIEFDGILHFLPKFGVDVLESTKNKDKLLDLHIAKHNWILIRVSYDQFIYSTKSLNKAKQDTSYFKQECLNKIIEILNNKVPGIYKIGDVYG
jgi:very-short-patch-repair endonuclease